MEEENIGRNKTQEKSDFWWFMPNEAVKCKYVCLGYQEPYSDEPNSNRDPLSVSWFHSLDASGNLSKVLKRYPLYFIDQWRTKCANTNVFRSLSVFTAEQEGKELLWPFVIDIDRDEYESGKGYVQHLDTALEATRQLVTKYLCQLKESDFRIFFTGHKGFNIEVRPEAIGIASVSNRRQEFERRLADINTQFGHSSSYRFVDRFHSCVRLHNSINSWIGNDGKKTFRMKFEISPDELNSLSVHEICTKAESLASNSLELL